MKAVNLTLLALLAGGITAQRTLAQGFSSGSDGSYGPLEITENTVLDLPPDGIFHCTTINIADGATLSFKRNPLNTPVYLLATEAVVIDGIIDVSGAYSPAEIPDGGRGGPGGFDGGKPGFTTVPPGAGLGPGGGKGGVYDRYNPDGAGAGSYGSVARDGKSTRKGSVYGSPLLIPLIGGSGGGGMAGSPGRGGGGGGGAVLVASSVEIVVSETGKILAVGGGAGKAWPNYLHNSGSGGAIRLVAPVVRGTGELSVDSGNQGYGAFGRIRVDSIDRTRLQLTFVPTSVTSVGSTMLVFPDPTPRLDIMSAAGTDIPEGSGPVFVQLPYNSPTEQTVTVRATDFFSIVPIKVVLTPDNGEPVIFEATIDNRTENPAETVVNVVMPVNVQVTIHVWTQ